MITHDIRSQIHRTNSPSTKNRSQAYIILMSVYKCCGLFSIQVNILRQAKCVSGCFHSFWANLLKDFLGNDSNSFNQINNQRNWRKQKTHFSGFLPDRLRHLFLTRIHIFIFQIIFWEMTWHVKANWSICKCRYS